MQAQHVVAACEKQWDNHKADCSGFARAVAADLGVPLAGLANQIVDFVTENWWSITDGVEAADWAEAGYFVIGGLKESGHGHVVVVVPGPLNRGKYPTAYWGRLNSVGKKAETINWAWRASDLPKVTCAGTMIHV
jgi:hypothetical protein